MGVLYEHWRTDINEGFYVGASWSNPESRPYEMKRSDDHLRVQKEVKVAGELVEVRIIECDHLSDKELDEFETLQIAYWKELIGDRLVNKAKGGRMSCGFNWTEESKQKFSEFKNTEKERLKAADIVLNLWKNPSYVEKVTAARKIAMNSHYYKELQRQISLKRWEDQKKRDRHSLLLSDVWSSEKLLFVQSKRTRNNWKDENIRTKRLRGLNREEVIKTNRIMMSGKWQTTEFRFKMLYRDWHNSVKRIPYWGA